MQIISFAENAEVSEIFSDWPTYGNSGFKTVIEFV